MEGTNYLDGKIGKLVFWILTLYLAVLLVTQVTLSALVVQEPLRSFLELVVYSVFWFLVIPAMTAIPDGSRSFSRFISFTKLNQLNEPLKLIGYGFGSGLIFLLILGFYTNILYQSPPDFNAVISWKLLWGNIAAFFEEFAIRGLVLGLLLLKNKQGKAVFYSALIFGAGHLVTFLLGNDLYHSMLMVLYAFVFGLVFSMLVIISNSLVPSIIFHMMINSFSPIFGGQLSVVSQNELILLAAVTASFFFFLIFRKSPSWGLGYRPSK